MAGLTLSACGESGAEDGTSGGGKLTVSSIPGAMDGLLVEIAEAQGYFEDEGVKVELVPAASVPASVTAAISGDVDLAYTNPVVQILSNIKATSDDTRLAQVVASMAPVPGGFVASDKVGLSAGMSLKEKLSALKGRSVGVPAIGSQAQRIYEQMLKWAKMPADSVTFLAVGLGATSLSAMSAGQVDAIYASEPTFALAESQGAVPVYEQGITKDDPLLYPALGGAYSATLGTLRKRSSDVLKFRAALRKAKDFVADPKNTGEVAALWHQSNQALSKEQMEQLIGKYRANYAPLLEDCAAARNSSSYLRGTTLPADHEVDCASLVWDEQPK